MLFNRVYDEKDLTRYKKEREQVLAEWEKKLRAADVAEDLIATFAKQQCDKVVAPPALSGVEIVHTGVQAEQHFSTSLITEFLNLGIVEIHGNQLTLHAAPEDLHYTIQREPGRWCLHCGEKLADDANGEMARLHIAMKHKGIPSPSEDEPSGYQWLTYFEYVLDARQHNQYKKGDRNG